MEQIVFPIPEMCEYLTHDTKVRVFNTSERDDQGSKVADFFQRADDMFDEMKWQKKLRGRQLKQKARGGTEVAFFLIFERNKETQKMFCLCKKPDDGGGLCWLVTNEKIPPSVRFFLCFFFYLFLLFVSFFLALIRGLATQISKIYPALGRRSN